MVGNGGRKTADIEVMTTKLYVGNLPFATTAQELEDLFADTGAVTSVELIFDKLSGRSRGFGFVNTATPADAQKIIEKFNGAELGGRSLSVNEAKPREERPARPFSSAGREGTRNSYRGSQRNERNYRR